MESKTRFIVAVKREQRNVVPESWKQDVADCEELELISPRDVDRLVVEASPKAIECLREQLGEYLHIESEVQHDFVREEEWPEEF